VAALTLGKKGEPPSCGGFTSWRLGGWSWGAHHWRQALYRGAPPLARAAL